MKVEGSYALKVAPERAWDMLMDPQVLKGCIPGCEKLEPAGEDTFEAQLKVGVAAIKGTYECKITLSDKQRPKSYKMLVEGSGAAGIVKGEGTLELFESKSGGTDIRVTGDASMAGPIARVGQRLVGAAAKVLMNQFFNSLKKRAG